MWDTIRTGIPWPPGPSFVSTDSAVRTEGVRLETTKGDRGRLIGFRNYRIRALLNTGKPSWDLLKSITPAVIPKTATPY